MTRDPVPGRLSGRFRRPVLSSHKLGRTQTRVKDRNHLKDQMFIVLIICLLFIEFMDCPESLYPLSGQLRDRFPVGAPGSAVTGCLPHFPCKLNAGWRGCLTD